MNKLLIRLLCYGDHDADEEEDDDIDDDDDDVDDKNYPDFLLLRMLRMLLRMPMMPRMKLMMKITLTFSFLEWSPCWAKPVVVVFCLRSKPPPKYHDQWY